MMRTTKQELVAPSGQMYTDEEKKSNAFFYLLITIILKF